MCQKTLLGVVVVCLVLSDRNPINIHWHVRSGSSTRAVICVWIDTDMYNISRWAILKCKRCYLKWGPRSLKLVVFIFHLHQKMWKIKTSYCQIHSIESIFVKLYTCERVYFLEAVQTVINSCCVYPNVKSN